MSARTGSAGREPSDSERARLREPSGGGTPTSSVTLINVFEVPIEQVDHFITRWSERAALLAAKPGFVDTRLHRALSADARFQLVNVAHWETRDAWQAATDDQEFRRSADEARGEMPFAANPALYEVAMEVRRSRPASASRSRPRAVEC